jgi:hypothetical protein
VIKYATALLVEVKEIVEEFWPQQYWYWAPKGMWVIPMNLQTFIPLYLTIGGLMPSCFVMENRHHVITVTSQGTGTVTARRHVVNHTRVRRRIRWHRRWLQQVTWKRLKKAGSY